MRNPKSSRPVSPMRILEPTVDEKKEGRLDMSDSAARLASAGVRVRRDRH
jgi:hypothetical protein